MADASLEVVVFHLERYRCAVPITQVVELARAVAVLPLPQAPAVVEGVIDFRGAIVPMLDIRQRFALPSKPVSDSDHLIVARTNQRVVALRVDSVVGIETIDKAPDDVGSLAPAAPHVSGVARLPDGLVVIHDLDLFLSADETQQIDHAVAALSERSQDA